MKVLVTDRLSDKGLGLLRDAGGFEVVNKVGLAKEALLAEIADAEALVVRSETKVTREVIAAAAKLRVIGRAGVGVDNIDVAAANERGIVVMNTPGGNTVTTGEHAISLMLSLARKIPQGTMTMKRGEWAKKKLTGMEIMGKTLGVIGLGNIGRVVADRARGLKMQVIGFDPFLNREAAEKIGVDFVELDELFRRADIVTVHTPLTDETKGIINRETFAKMKDGVLVINAARGGIVDEAALVEAIQSGKVGGAALDVFVEEPPPKDHPLLALDNVICTPHLGAATEEAAEKVAYQVSEQIRDFLLKGEIRNAVNVPSVSADELPRLRPYLTLAERLGGFLGQTLEDAPREIAVEYLGDARELNTAALTNAVLRGLLAPLLDRVVNDVSAPVVARERGVRVSESKASRDLDFSNLIQVVVTTTKGTARVAGAVLGKGNPRLVRFNDFFLEGVLDGNIVVLQNQDVPGVVGRLGTVLGEKGINIAGLELGRDKKSGRAVSLFHVDAEVPKDVLELIRKQPAIVSATQVKLGH
ncbi:MAG: phosphoglycerate dehydrogenase [Deltaproteobacteria bacterium]|nr:phosphoglycerate dehydrogenase [Deltaproteobacteria bacterium]